MGSGTGPMTPAVWRELLEPTLPGINCGLSPNHGLSPNTRRLADGGAEPRLTSHGEAVTGGRKLFAKLAWRKPVTGMKLLKDCGTRRGRSFRSTGLSWICPKYIAAARYTGRKFRGTLDGFAKNDFWGAGTASPPDVRRGFAPPIEVGF